MKADLIISLGPNCRNAWNLRHHFGLERAYPFDWWITPSRSALAMLEPSFRFHVTLDDLHISNRLHNTVYNSRLNVLHHHDFRRISRGPWKGSIRMIDSTQVEQLNEKYAFLFRRMQAHIKASSRPVFVINRVDAGFKTRYQGLPTRHMWNGYISTEDFAQAVRFIVGKRARVVDIADGESIFTAEPWGWFIRVPDSGQRELSRGHFAEPVHVHRKALDALGLTLLGTQRAA